MIPSWLTETDDYTPPKDSSAFVVRTLRSIGAAMARLRIQRGQTGRLRIPAVGKLLLLLTLLIAVSVLQNRLALLAITALLLGYLSFWPAARLWSVLRPALGAAALTLLLLLPAMLLRPSGMQNQLTVVWKVFLSLCAVGMFNRTTQWNDVTGALRRLHVPGVFVFTLDLTLKFIVRLGALLRDTLTALRLRAVGKNKRKYQSVGGVLGVTFLHASSLSRETYAAMVCRGYGGDEKEL